MVQPMSTFQGEDQFDTALLLTMREELQTLRSQTDARFSGLEEALQGLADDVKKLVVLQPPPQDPPVDDEQSLLPPPSDNHYIHQEPGVDVEDVGSSWNYIIAQKGGYNNLLYVTIQELLDLGEDGIAFLAFLSQKRALEVQHRLQQLRSEYQRLQGNQLQEHFQELWKSHYLLLKHKQSRTWEEDIFLTAFDAFIIWIQT